MDFSEQLSSISQMVGMPPIPLGGNNVNANIPEGEEPEPKINIKDSRGYKSGSYSRKHIEGIIKASKAVGIDPYQALALTLQESEFATAKPRKFRGGGISTPTLGQIMDFEPAQEKELDEKSKTTGIDPMYLKVAIALRDKIKYAKQLGFKDEASQLQAYNGYGTITKRTFGGADKAYGVPIGEGIDMKKNPLYGKRLVELKNDISSIPEIKKMVGTNQSINSGQPNPLSVTR